jgi:PII-like signaling protein
MKTEGEAHRLRIYVNESDRLDGRPLYEQLVREARDMGLAGATAIRGIEGFGANDKIHTVKVLRLSEDLPVVIEIIEQPARVAAFLTKVDALVAEGMVTIEAVRTINYRREPGFEPAVDDELQLESPAEAPPKAVPAAPAVVARPRNERAEKIIDVAKKSAKKARHAFADSVDVLLAMLCESKGIATQALAALGIDCETASRNLREAVSRDETSGNYIAMLDKKSAAAAKWLDHDESAPSTCCSHSAKFVPAPPPTR